MENRGTSGFTFVEALAVAIIVAILAAVAIPVYSGYISKQRSEVVKNLATTAAVAANVHYRRHNSDPTVPQLNLFIPDPSRYSVSISAGKVHILDDLGGGDIVRDSASFR